MPAHASPSVTALDRHIEALDGVRAVAVLSVMVFHADEAWLPGGFLGVDVFFVLSGYLITALLVREHVRTGRCDFRRFYLRRLLRLGPALVLMVAGFLAAAALLPSGPPLGAAARESAYALAFVANWVRAFRIDTMPLLGHAWSLSIEEQFYLLWPITLVLLLGGRRGRALDTRLARAGGLAAAAAVATAVVRARLFEAGWPIERLYNGLDLRADAILSGCALALLTAPAAAVDEAPGADIPTARAIEGRASHPTVAATVALASLGVLAWLAATANWMAPATYRWGLATAAVASAGLVWSLTRGDRHPVAWLLTRPWLTWLGRISYGLYLWHFPVNGFLRRWGWSDASILAIGPAATVALAALSFTLVERRFLALKTRLQAR